MSLSHATKIAPCKSALMGGGEKAGIVPSVLTRIVGKKGMELGPTYTIRFCRMRQAHDRPTT